MICRTLLAAACAVALAGCGDRGPKLVPAAGIVLIDGKPLTHGVVQVVPAGGRAASGKIGPDGRFTLTTFRDNDGCYVGTHPVAVVANESIDGTSQRWHAPKKYVSADASGLTVTITGPTDDLKVELTWDGGKPFVQHFSKE